MGSGTLLVSLELVVALPYHTAVLVGGVPALGSEETATVTAYQLRGEYGLRRMLPVFLSSGFKLLLRQLELSQVMIAS